MSEKTEYNILNKKYSTIDVQNKLDSLFAVSTENVKNIVQEEKDFIFPIDWTDMSRHVYFNSAFQKTKTIADKLIREWPLGINGNIVERWNATEDFYVSGTASITSLDQSVTSRTEYIQQRIDEKIFWKQDIEYASTYYNNLTNYEKWVLSQLAGATIYFNDNNSITSVQTFKQPTFYTTGIYIPFNMPLSAAMLNGMVSFTGDAYSYTGTVISYGITQQNVNENYLMQLPVILRDTDNMLMMPFGHPYSNNDDYVDELVGTFDTSQSLDAAPFYEILLTTALAFDDGIHFSLTDNGGTGSDKIIWNNYNGTQESQYYPWSDIYPVYRPARLNKLIPPAFFMNDNEKVLEKTLSIMADVLDDTKIYVDNLTGLFKNYWSNWHNLPKGMIQKMVAFQLGVELFSSSNGGINDLVLRGKRSVTDITYEFWNRVLCTLIYSLKTKGTLESIKSVVAAYGFPENLLEVNELCHKYNSFDSYKSDIQSTYALCLGPDINEQNATYIVGPQVPMSGTAATFFTELWTASADYSISFRMKVKDETKNSGDWKYLFNVNNPFIPAPNIYIQTLQNPVNANQNFTSFKVEIQTTGVSLTTGYDFWNNVASKNNDGFISVILTKTLSAGIDNYTLYLGSNGSSVYYEEPTIEMLSFTSINTNVYLNGDFGNIYDESYTPNIWIQEFIIDKNYMAEKQVKARINNFENFSSINFDNVDSIVRYYKFKEGAIGGNIIDSSVYDQNLVANVLDSTMFPYRYFDDQFKSIKYRDVGFNLPLTNKTSDLTISDIQLSNMRIGISNAKPINEDIENYLGDVEISDLMFDVLEYFNVSNTSNLRYPNLEQKRDEIFQRYNETFKPWKMSKFIERVEGHLSSFFSYIEQFIPVTEKVIEKGVIYEDYNLSKFRLRKPWISTPFDIMQTLVYTISPSVTTIMLENPNILLYGVPEEIIRLIYPDAIRLQPGITLDTILTNIRNMNLEVLPKLNVFKPKENIVVNAIQTSFNVNKLYTNGVKFNKLPISANLIKLDNNPIEIQTFPKWKTILFNNVTYLKPSTVKKNVNDYVQSLSFLIRNIFVSTQYAEQNDKKYLIGYVKLTNSFYDSLSKFQSKNVPVIQLDTSEFKDANGYNLLRIIIDDKNELSNIDTIYNLTYPNKNGIKFMLTTIGSISEGIDLNQEIKLKFINLINPNDDIIVLNFYIGYSLEGFTGKNQYSLTTDI